MAYHTGQCFNVRKLSDSCTVFHAPKTLARLFKTNDVSLNLISEVNFTNMPIFFVEKNVRSFCCKASLMFSTQNFSVLGD